MKEINSVFNIKRIAKALKYALCGIKTIFIEEAAFKQEILITLFIIPLGIYFGSTAIEQSILISCWFLVLILEAVNSSIEAIVDRISLEIHPLSKKIKDISSAAVLLAIINAIIIWAIILRHKL
jgi:diacylglycerol kinase (ATP)